MATAQGDYGNPAYLMRPVVSTPVIGGAATTTYAAFAVPVGVSAVRLRSVTAVIQASNTAASTWTYYNGTTSIGKVVFATASGAAKNTTFTIPDMNATLLQANTFGIVTGSDAAGTAVLFIEHHIDPAATFSGNP